MKHTKIEVVIASATKIASSRDFSPETWEPKPFSNTIIKWYYWYDKKWNLISEAGAIEMKKKCPEAHIKKVVKAVHQIVIDY